MVKEILNQVAVLVAVAQEVIALAMEQVVLEALLNPLKF